MWYCRVQPTAKWQPQIWIEEPSHLHNAFTCVIVSSKGREFQSATLPQSSLKVSNSNVLAALRWFSENPWGWNLRSTIWQSTSKLWPVFERQGSSQIGHESLNMVGMCVVKSVWSLAMLRNYTCLTWDRGNQVWHIHGISWPLIRSPFCNGSS